MGPLPEQAGGGNFPDLLNCHQSSAFVQGLNGLKNVVLYKFLPSSPWEETWPPVFTFSFHFPSGYKIYEHPTILATANTFQTLNKCSLCEYANCDI